MVTLPPGPPTEISVSGDDLDFTPPEYDGGGRVTEYQVQILIKSLTWAKILKSIMASKCLIIQYIISYLQVHLLEVNSNGDWKVFSVVPVRHLSASPNIPPALFQGLKGKSFYQKPCSCCSASFYQKQIQLNTGCYLLRVVARNAAGVGPGNTIVAEFTEEQSWCKNILTKLKILPAFSRCIGLRKPSIGWNNPTNLLHPLVRKVFPQWSWRRTKGISIF